MTYSEYLEEHGHDVPFDGLADEHVLGICECCLEDVTSLDAAYTGTFDGETVYLHEECLMEYIERNVPHDRIAELFGLRRVAP